MKRVLLLGILLAPPVMACDKGCYEYKGTCACDQMPEQSEQGVQASSETPSRHPEPAYQRGEVVPAMPQSLIASDAELDREKEAAEAQGKKAAGIKN